MDAKEEFTLPQELKDSLAGLSEMITAEHDKNAAMLYRLMFRHETDLNVLDRYADCIVDELCGFGSKFAEEDYRNYLQYLKCVCPSKYPEYKEWFDETMAEMDNDLDDEDEL